MAAIETIFFGSIVVIAVLAVYAIYLFAKTKPEDRALPGEKKISFLEGIGSVAIVCCIPWLSPKFNDFVLSLPRAGQFSVVIATLLFLLALILLAKYVKGKT